jgi:hypothetical protein
MNLVDIPPGEQMPEHQETERGQEEVFYAVSGRPTLVVDGEVARRPPARSRASIPSTAGPSATTATGPRPCSLPPPRARAATKHGVGMTTTTERLHELIVAYDEG